MTRSVWLKADDAVGDWDDRRKRITAGLEAGVDWVLVDAADVGRVRELGDVNVAAFSDGDAQVIDEAEERAAADAYVVGKDGEGDGTVDLPNDFSGSADLTTLRRDDDRADGAYVRILSEKYEAFAEAAADEADYTIVVGEDWTIIPLENLIARIGDETDLVAGVTSAEEAKTAFETLEIGSDAVLLDTDDPDEIRRTVEVRDEAEREQLEFEWAEVKTVERTGSADRVCVDTGSLMDHDEGDHQGRHRRGSHGRHGPRGGRRTQGLPRGRRSPLRRGCRGEHHREVARSVAPDRSYRERVRLFYREMAFPSVGPLGPSRSGSGVVHH